MAALIGLSTADVQAHRLAVARDFAATHRLNVVLKGHRTIVATPEGFVLRDLGTPGGTTLGGYRVREALLAPGAAEPIWAPLPDVHTRATEHLATSLASRLSESSEYPSRFRTRLQPRLARLALVKLRRAGIEELHDPRAPEVLGAELHRLVTDPDATLPGPARAAALFATLEET